MAYPIDPRDPALPEAWKKQPTYMLEVATLSRIRPEDAEDAEWKLEELHPGWHVSHDIEEDWFNPLDDASGPEEYEAIFAKLPELQSSYLEQCVQKAGEFFRTNDFRKVEGLAKLFAGRSGGYITPEQRQSLISQINTPIFQRGSGAIRQAFVELEGGFAVAGVIFQELEYPTYITPFVSASNPVLTLIGREVVVCRDLEYETPLAQGLLELDGNHLVVGSWNQDFGEAEVDGTPFEDVEISSSGGGFFICEKTSFQTYYAEETP